jgi:hypothetical protein
MSSPEAPFISTWVEAELSSPPTIEIHFWPKPNLAKTSRRKAQSTVSKAFVISNLRRIVSRLSAWSFRAVL